MTRLLALLPAALLLAACEAPTLPGPAPSGSGPLLAGAAPEGAAIRIGLIGRKTPSGADMELVSAPVAAGRYSLSVPAKPRLDFMVDDNESILLTLRAYEDVNGNGRYDSGDRLTDDAAAGATFRYFDTDGPSGAYRAGWNQFRDGAYTQDYSTAFNFSSET